MANANGKIMLVVIHRGACRAAIETNSSRKTYERGVSRAVIGPSSDNGTPDCLANTRSHEHRQLLTEAKSRMLSL